MFDSAKKEAIPLYSRVATIIQHKIISGQYGPGEQLPTEDDLVGQYQVSKITIRNALSLLEAEGLIKRIRGKGTFVTDHVPEIKQSIHTSLNEMVLSLADSHTKPLEIKVIKVAESRIPKDIVAFFKMTNIDEIARIRRLVTRENVVYFYENYILPDMAKHITKKELAEKKSITKILHKKTGLSISKGEMYLQAIPAEPDISKLLQCQAFEPLIHVQTYFWSEPGQPFEIVNRYLRACYFKYKVDVTISSETS
ncbi:MAG: GntR family transcriptional regulator [Proteobacteria bacterium]|nr:GntR family transcriptional regulator [Pseudomonadota bacterium]MBU4471278.1 GntR family transcriptional regulator [Pseudomonadota bacterium]MCG2753898.1 GntR family transcriptional regulator [Desulfobacteraceae bacterium]